MKILTKWDQRFLESARQKAAWSKDPSMKVGAVAVNPKRKMSISHGWNGFPRGIEDSHERLHNRPVKHQYMVHAEMNMIYNATLNGISLDQSVLYVHGLPVCSKCSLGIIQVGITSVICSIEEDLLTPEQIDQWVNHEWVLTKENFDEVGIEHTLVRL